MSRTGFSVVAALLVLLLQFSRIQSTILPREFIAARNDVNYVGPGTDGGLVRGDDMGDEIIFLGDDLEDDAKTDMYCIDQFGNRFGDLLSNLGSHINIDVIKKVSQRISHFINTHFDRISTWSGDNWGYLGLPDSSMYLPKSTSEGRVEQPTVDGTPRNSTDTATVPLTTPALEPVKRKCNQLRCAKDSPARCANGSC